MARRKRKGPFCGPGETFPVDSQGRAKNAITRAVQHRRGLAKERIIHCACRRLKRKYRKVTPACEARGF